MHNSIEQYMQTVGQQARQASRLLASASTDTKNNALSAIYTALENSETQILTANQMDMTRAGKIIWTMPCPIAWNLLPAGSKVSCSCPLYTSPSPRDQALTRMPLSS